METFGTWRKGLMLVSEDTWEWLDSQKWEITKYQSLYQLPTDSYGHWPPAHLTRD